MIRGGQCVTQIAQARADSNPELPEVILHFRNASSAHDDGNGRWDQGAKGSELAQRAPGVLDVGDTIAMTRALVAIAAAAMSLAGKSVPR